MFIFFFFNDPATTEIYPLPLHDALPISLLPVTLRNVESELATKSLDASRVSTKQPGSNAERSEEHTSELQSRLHLVCRLLLEKKKNKLSWIAIDLGESCHQKWLLRST